MYVPPGSDSTLHLPIGDIELTPASGDNLTHGRGTEARSLASA
jgi:hypothetical protein